LKMDEFNVLVAGVGGQGVLLVSSVLGNTAVKEGLNVRVSELHGMAQRGGSVVCHVRIGKKVYAPTIMEGRANVILGLELLETLRNVKFASTETMILVNNEKIVPSGISNSSVSYPPSETILKQIRDFTQNVFIIDAVNLAKKAGNVLTRNVVMLGALAATERLPLSLENLKATLREVVRPKYVETNLKALKFGYEAFKQLVQNPPSFSR